MTEISLWQFVLARLSRSESVMLLCVVDSRGSSPGRRGFKMAVAEDGFHGSIGGGVMEYKFVELAKEKLHAIPGDPLIRKQLHNKSAEKDQSGMICSGEQTIALFHLTRKHEDMILRLLDSLLEHRNGTLEITPADIIYSEDSHEDSSGFFEMKTEADWIYREATGYTNHIYIVGAGHCANALSQLMRSMNFYIHLFDDRKDLNTFKENNFVHEKKIVDDYSALARLIPSGKNNYVVIMTFGFVTDDIALRALIDKNFKYIGVLGSKAKIRRMMNEWKRDNLPEEKLKLLHAPVGISIHSQTTTEIAVSIAAEIIGVKNEKV